MLGTDANSCDIVLPLTKGVSRCHWYLTFDEERRVVVRDCSSNGTTVTFDGKGGEKRRHFTWILGGHRVPGDAKTIFIRLHAVLKFQIVLAKPTFPHLLRECGRITSRDGSNGRSSFWRTRYPEHRFNGSSQRNAHAGTRSDPARARDAGPGRFWCGDSGLGC